MIVFQNSIINLNKCQHQLRAAGSERWMSENERMGQATACLFPMNVSAGSAKIENDESAFSSIPATPIPYKMCMRVHRHSDLRRSP
jgi:hypothetical protein